VAFGFDGGPDGLDFAVLADKERTAHDAHEFVPHEPLLLPSTVSFDGFVIRVAQQGKIESVLGLEDRLRFDGIGAHREDGDFELVELFLCVAKLGRLDDSTGSVGFWEEKKEDALAFEIFQGDEFIFVGWDAEPRSFVAGLEHGSEWKRV